jgi:hypothetical protein
MDPVSISVVLTLPDYIRSIRAYYLHEPGTRGALLMMCVFACLIALVLPVNILDIRLYGPSAAEMGSLIVILLFFLIFAAFPLFILIAPIVLGRRLWHRQGGKDTNAVLMNEQGLQVTGSQETITPGWASFKRVMDTKGYYLMTYDVSKTRFIIIPKRAFTSPEHEAAFRALVEKHLGPIKR